MRSPFISLLGVMPPQEDFLFPGVSEMPCSSLYEQKQKSDQMYDLPKKKTNILPRMGRTKAMELDVVLALLIYLEHPVASGHPAHILLAACLLSLSRDAPVGLHEAIQSY